MAGLVQIQTLRGNAGLEEAVKAVEAAVAKRNSGAAEDDQHVVNTFAALPPNVKGMQVQLSLLAVLARNHGCTLIRLNVHNGNVALCGTAAEVAQVQEVWTPHYNAMSTLASATYSPAVHGPRMGFTNGFLCGMAAGMIERPAVLGYGIGSLFSFPKPGNGTAYDLGAAALIAKEETPVKAPVVPRKPRQRKAA